jgi:hypothetical protein
VRAIVSTMRVILALCILDGACAATWYVDGSIPRAGDGTSWENAVQGIQAGINKASDGDTVIVAEGTYVENINFDAKNIVLRSTNPMDWAVVKQTIIDGNRSSAVVMFRGTEDETCVLSGFTIQNGIGPWIADVGMSGGGGILGWDPDTNSETVFTLARIERNIIMKNKADMGGGVRYCKGLIRNNIIIANEGGDASNGRCGGGISLCRGIIENNLLLGNFAPRGGAISYSNAVFRNNTVVGNTALYHGGGLWQVGNSPYLPAGGSITNCIIWGNTAPLGPQIHESVAPTYSFIEGWTEGGEGNRSGDPRFVDPDGADNDPNTFEDNDYRLLATSPCIDAGINEDWMAIATDLDGRPRILLGATSLTVDMGAYELTFPLAIVRSTPTDIELSWTMRPVTTYTVLSTFDITAQPWTEETTFSGGKTGGPASWLDLDASSALKFYRIAVE